MENQHLSNAQLKIILAKLNLDIATALIALNPRTNYSDLVQMRNDTINAIASMILDGKD